jgi:Flp pilus assembly protein TadG
MASKSTFRSPFRRFLGDEHGAFAVMFGVMAIVLVALGGAVVDYVTLEQGRQRAQLALDAAVLALQPEIFVSVVTDESIRSRAEAFVIERVANASIAVEVDQVVADRNTGRLSLGGRFTVPTVFVALVGVQSLGAAFNAEAIRGSVDVEVAVALDVTGSMDGQDILDLRASVGGLVDTIVQDVQEPNYTKVALVPYSQAVNAGSYATALRGPIRGPKNISNISWAESTTRTITAVSLPRNGAVTITSNGHGYNNNDWVYVWEVSGTTQLNGRAYQVTAKAANTFQLLGESANNYSTYRSGGKIRRCTYANCQIQVTSNNHGYSAGQYLHITGVGGLTGVNNQSYLVASAATNTVMLSGLPTSGAGTYTSNTGQLHCTWQNATEGCSYYRFQSATGSWNTFAATNCVTERAVNPFNDQPPTASFVGRNYPPSGNPCLVNTIVPLSANKSTLHAAINSLSAGGSTAGALGILWTWYMLAPNFGYVWPFESQPAPYNSADLLKAAIIMTDGEFNTVHCNGAVARNSTSGSGSTSDQINCDAHNGAPYAQARAYCDAMKSNTTGIVVYTVGFAISEGSPAANMLASCASSPNNYYLASNGSRLREVFGQIARDISSLRLTR